MDETLAINVPNDLHTDNPFWASEQEKEIVKAMAGLYVSYRGRFNLSQNGAYIMPKKKGIPVVLDNVHLRNHLRRKYAVAIFAGAQSSRFLCFDVDTSDMLAVQRILRGLLELGIPREMLHVSTSGGKGFHIDLFFDSLMFTKDLKRLYDYLATTIDMTLVEFRPTHKQSIKLPLSVHGKTGNVCWYLNRDTLTPIEDPAYVLGITPFSADAMLEIIHALPAPVVEKTDKVTVPSKHHGPVSYGIRITSPDTRHELMFQLAKQARYDGLSGEACLQMLTDWYADQDPDLIASKPSEVDQDIARITNWVYDKSFKVFRSSKDVVDIDMEDVAMVLAQQTGS